MGTGHPEESLLKELVQTLTASLNCKTNGAQSQEFATTMTETVVHNLHIKLTVHGLILLTCHTEEEDSCW